jgi:uncharacterized protein YjbJ (UPF0337 family)
MSNSEQIKGNWNELKGKLKQNLQNLPKTICYLTKEKKTKCGKLQQKLGKTEKKLNHYLTNLQSIY